MDIDILRSISEDQTEMMMMMHFEKQLPADFSAAVYGTADHQGAAGSSTNLQINANISQCFIEDDSSNFLNPPSSSTNNISFSSSPTPPAGGGEMQFLSSSRWRNGVGTDAGEEEAHSGRADQQQKRNSMAAMREMIFRIAAMQPIHIDPESVKPPKRRNVKISKDPQSVAARHRRERISERIRILQRLVPGGTKMDTASMLDEAIHYVKFLKNQVQTLEKAGVDVNRTPAPGNGFPVPMSSGTYNNIPTPAKDYQQQNVMFRTI